MNNDLNENGESGNSDKGKSTSGLWAYLKAFIMLGAIALGWLLLSITGFTEHVGDYSWVNDKIKSYGAYGPLLFIAFFGVSTVIGIPRLLISAIAGFAFDIFPAILIALASTLLGCIISFYYARLMGRSIIQNIMSMRMKNYEKFLVEHDFLAGIAIRALPISNNSIANLLAGVTGVRPLHYFAGSAIGYIPLTVVFVLAGSGFQQDMTSRLLLSVALYLFLVIPIGYFIQKRIRSMANQDIL